MLRRTRTSTTMQTAAFSPSSVRVGMTYTSASPRCPRPRCAPPAPGVRHPEGDHTGPLPSVEDLGHLALAAFPQVGIDECLDGVGAHGVLGRDAEQLLRAQAPLVDESVGADGEGRDLDVVVDGAGRAALPHRVTERRAVRRALGPRGPRWYLAHANRPLQLTASGTGHRGAAARSIQHYGAAQHGVHDHSTVPMVFGPDRDNTSSLLTSGHGIESRSSTTATGLNQLARGSGPGAGAFRHGSGRCETV